jgi:PPOX class probable F420-dependent enzyme
MEPGRNSDGNRVRPKRISAIETHTSPNVRHWTPRGDEIVELCPETIRDRLDRWPVARLATIGVNGRPHQVPIVFASVGKRLWSPVDGKPKSGGELARVSNIRARPDAGLLLDQYSSDWRQLWWIRIEARGRVVQPEVPQEDAEFQAALEALAEKYPQYREVPLVQTPPTLLVFEALKIRSWCASSSVA